MSEKKMVRRSVAIAIGIICIILVACLVGAFAGYMLIANDKNNTISSLHSEVTALQNQILSDNSTINSLNPQIAELENQLASDNSTVASDNATIVNLQNQITTLQNQVKSLRNQIVELSNNLGSLQSQYEQLNQTYTSSFLFNSSLWPVSPENTLWPQIFITYPAGFQEYANAILKICATALGDYVEVFNMPNKNYFDHPLTIHIFIYTDASSVSLGNTAYDYRIYLYVRSIEDMQPPSITGFHWVYGFIHELGHIMFPIYNGEFDEGWAHYAASIRILPGVYSQLGDDAWPQPYNYSQTEGSARFLSEINNSSLTTPGSYYAAAKILYMIDQKYGPLIFKEAMDMCHPTDYGLTDYPIYSLAEFKNALVSLTNDTSLSQLFEGNGF
jgi:uncharacterized coiled-coil protein SlyX